MCQTFAPWEYCLACQVTAIFAETVTSAIKSDDNNFISMFNGKDLTGWRGREGFWSAKDGMIVGSETQPISPSTYLVYTAIPKIADFELHYKYKFVTRVGNSGVQFRSKIVNEAVLQVGGYQADCDAGGAYDGSIYDELGIVGNRQTMSNLGQKTVWDVTGKRINTPLAESEEQLRGIIRHGDWNDVVLIANGNHITYTVNGHLTTDLIDNDARAAKEGVIALQLHQGMPMQVQFKDLKIKVLNPLPSAVRHDR